MMPSHHGSPWDEKSVPAFGKRGLRAGGPNQSSLKPRIHSQLSTLNHQTAAADDRAPDGVGRIICLRLYNDGAPPGLSNIGPLWMRAKKPQVTSWRVLRVDWRVLLVTFPRLKVV